MGQFGQELRSAREARGVAIESISGVTKISGRHLLALEQENFSALPGGVLNKGIVRGYARVCGMDEEAWVNRYLNAYHQSGQIKDDDQSWIEFAENVGKTRHPDPETAPDKRLRWAGVAGFLVLLMVFAWYVLHFVEVRSAHLPVPAGHAAAHALPAGWSTGRCIAPAGMQSARGMGVAGARTFAAHGTQVG
ncbi:RodZ family helix-turn-helix domain-containing protein [Acidipila sp. EB88]|uniref:helix-turn-helix domain-containing protein n=1 Tax=Acidipila sp. EB88 TaxID=2305226 RepID=UPI000F5F4641|nr:helix-turn-helix domain-containing protein [Acidipila sp. EB88]RRA48485.1 helix-turn-helix domain-containing protein [Acidipila sp. EB88]